MSLLAFRKGFRNFVYAFRFNLLRILAGSTYFLKQILIFDARVFFQQTKFFKQKS